MKILMNNDLSQWLKAHHETNVLRVAVDIVLVWSVIILSIWFGLHYSTWWSYLLAIIMIGSRQHALGTLVHDGTHFTLAKNRSLNDFLCDIFCAFPIFISTRGFRIFHITHHRFTRTDKDPEVHAKDAHPDYIWPKNKWGAYSTLLRDLVGINAKGALGNMFIWSDIPSLLAKSKEYWMQQKIVPGIAEFLDRTDPKFKIDMSIKLRLIIFYGTLFSALSYFGLWTIFLLYWVVPLISIVAFVIRLRGMSEHNGLSFETELDTSRTTLWPNPVLGYLVTPFAVNHHLEHHLFPQVPYFHLKKLHRELLKNDLYKNKAAISRSYLANLITKNT